MANSLPFLSFEAQGQTRTITLLQASHDLFTQGFGFLAALVYAFVLLLPMLYLSLLLALLVPIKLGLAPALPVYIGRLLGHFRPWIMAEVFIVGVLIALIKVIELADIIIGLSFWAYVGFSILFTLTANLTNRHQLWHWIEHASADNNPTRVEPKTLANNYPKGSAAQKGLANCRTCHMLSDISLVTCPRCYDTLYLRSPNSIQRTLALVITAILFYIPANLYPIMTTTLFNDKISSTILSGVVLFAEHGSYFVAFVIFGASILIPIAKMLIILWLCYATSRQSRLSKSELTRLYRATEFIGKWSMIDIFVVAILVALVHITGIMIIEPGVAAPAFAGVVILTMVAAHQFDVRLMWDKQQ
ncbi:MAG: paraquat-inducible protein A [Alphaproteobacteria bacterium]|jgi:paraquat-inducible protein A